MTRCVVTRHLQGPNPRPSVRGPFLFLGDQKLTIRGVTYGTFGADAAGNLFPPRQVVASDFAAMREAGINAIRTYTAPPPWLFEEARAAGLWVLVGIYWDGRNCTFDDPQALRAAESATREAVRRCKPYTDVLLGWVIGNEIPPLVVRLHGRRIVERFLEQLAAIVRAEDPDGLVSYGTYPTTEFLQLDFADFVLLNVYLLEPQRLASYLDRMLIEAKGKPLLLGEFGEDSLSKGEAHQSDLLDWSIPLAFERGVAGLFVFSWTDDWVVGGNRVEDWAFGLVDRERQAKPALETVRKRFATHALAGVSVERIALLGWPKVSVVVCNYNGGATLDETLASLAQLDYPDYEVVYVDDGSTDDSLAIAKRYEGRIRIIAQPNQGLSVARNVGAEAATGWIVAYTDSDAYVDRDWLRFLVLRLCSGDYVAAGGPNLTPESDGAMAQLIAVCPGNPTYVLKDNVDADHIAGVNMAFRRDVLLGMGGFDPIHTRAGDDVDICWRLLDTGYKIAFSATAIVWHHRRPSMRRYLRQQYGYGEAENQLEHKHPERFNLAGSIRWAGRVYLAPKRVSAVFRPFIYHGRLGQAMFQTLYQKEPSLLTFGPAMIHWYLAWALLFVLSPLSWWMLFVAVVTFMMSVWVAVVAGITSEPPPRLSRVRRFQRVAVIALLHFLHPIVRFAGRIAPLDASLRRSARRAGDDRPRVDLTAILAEAGWSVRRTKQMVRYWGVSAGMRERVVRALHQELKAMRVSAVFGQEFDNYDLALSGALLNTGRIHTAPEHWDQALCIGIKAKTHWMSKLLLAGSWLACAAAVVLDWRLIVLVAVPIGLSWATLAARARLRMEALRAVDAVLVRIGATRYEAATANSVGASPRGTGPAVTVFQAASLAAPCRDEDHEPKGLEAPAPSLVTQQGTTEPTEITERGSSSQTL